MASARIPSRTMTFSSRTPPPGTALGQFFPAMVVCNATIPSRHDAAIDTPTDKPALADMRRALGVSLASRIWGAGLGILAVPIYVRILGIESYGLIGLFASLQVLISFLDFGLGTTMVREFGRLCTAPDGRREMRAITYPLQHLCCRLPRQSYSLAFETSLSQCPLRDDTTRVAPHPWRSSGYGNRIAALFARKYSNANCDG